MTRTTIRHGGMIACEMPGCPTTFVSYSMVSIVRRQAIAAGWGRLTINLLDKWQDRELGSDGRRKLDACPVHAIQIREDHAARVIADKARSAAGKVELARVIAADKRAAKAKPAKPAKTAKRKVSRARRVISGEAHAIGP